MLKMKINTLKLEKMAVTLATKIKIPVSSGAKVFGARRQESYSLPPPSETVVVARSVKRGKTACAPLHYFTASANCVFKVTSDAQSTVKYENWQVSITCFECAAQSYYRRPESAFPEAFESGIQTGYT